MTPHAIAPDLLYRDGEFHAGLAIVVAGAPGSILEVVPAESLSARGDDIAVTRLPQRAVLPGFVNAHSHAFQRLIRGRTQWRPADRPSADFWSWRAAMYGAAQTLSEEDVYDVARFCFLEMLHAGFTTVGEFHYLHRRADGRAYDDPNTLARRVIAAALDVGLRISLLNVAYATGGIDEPLAPEQRRFATPDLRAYLDATAQLADDMQAERLVTIGVAPHSVRAVPREWLAPIHGWAKARTAAFHIHVAEQPAEIEASLTAYALRPVELLAREGVVGPEFAAVHATHLTADEVALLGGAGATVVACPGTERDLGDGILPAAELIAAGARIALGSDSHTIIDPLEELRLIEYHERLRKLQRVVIGRVDAGRCHSAPVLLDMATRHGAACLRLNGGRLGAGGLADFVAIDLEHRALAGWTPDTLAAFVAFSAPTDVVTDVWVDGVRRVRERSHPLDHEIGRAFRQRAGRS